MSGDDKRVMLEKLKKKGSELERQLNVMLQNQLNSDEIIRLAGIRNEEYAGTLRQVKDNVELLSLHFNFPTKNDAANLARLIIQMEEKVDKLEEQLGKIMESMQVMNKKIDAIKASSVDFKNISADQKHAEGTKAILSMAPGKDVRVRSMERWLQL